MKKIPLTQEQFALVDDKDYKSLSKHRWYSLWSPRIKNFYAVGNSSTVNRKWKSTLMHREIMNPPVGFMVDHINHNTLDNRRKNLRICTRSQNMMNSGKQVNNTSGFKGVSWNKSDKKWRADISLNKKQIYLGNFSTKLLAYDAYVKACKKYHKEFAKYK